MQKKELYDILIIGGGCAGLPAAMYAGRFGLKTLVLAEQPGGTIILTDVVENYPGFIRLTGLELAQKLQEHAESYKDVTIKAERVVDVAKKGEHYWVKTQEYEYETKTIIFSTGTEWKKLNVPGEKELANKGVHYCALCDGAFYKNKILGVVGGSDSAAKEALLLTQWAQKVYIIYRGDQIHPEPINMERVLANKKIEIINNTNITEIKGEQKVTSVIFDKAYNGNKEFKLDAVFVEIGHIPLTELPKKLGVNLNKKGEVIIDREAKTNVPGIYAAGDCVDTAFKQAITGAAEGVSAAYSAYQYLSKE